MEHGHLLSDSTPQRNLDRTLNGGGREETDRPDNSNFNSWKVSSYLGLYYELQASRVSSERMEKEKMLPGERDAPLGQGVLTRANTVLHAGKGNTGQLVPNMPSA